MKTIKELYLEHGYFSLLFEKMEEWEWYTDLPCFKLMVHLIIKCMKKDTRYKGDSVLRGQYRTSRNRLAEETGLSVKQVRTALSKLEKTNELKWAKSRAKQRSIITLCNFEKYQPELLEGGQGRGQAGAKLGPRYKEEYSNKDKNTVRPPFENFWKEYPSGGSKKKAQEKWNRLLFENGLYEEIMTSLAKHKQTDQWKRGIIPHAVTWLNQERWKDELDKTKPGIDRTKPY